jgi:tetratricopeptide (TPR) repeat protein
MAAKKKIICPKCKAKLKFDLDKILSEVVKFKCPGCSSVLRIKKPVPQKETSLPSAISQPSDSKKESNIEQLGSESLAPGIESEIKKDLREIGQADKEKVVEPAISEKIEEDISAASKPLSEEKDGLLIPEGKIVPLKPPGDSLLEDYDHENLKEYEEGEAEAGDLEWTRYADNNGPLIPESKIDLNVIPASDSGLQDTLADLQQSETYNLQGENHLEKNRIKQAVRDFNHALEINPDYVDALVNRGSAYTLQSRYNDALRDFNHALKIDKKQAEIYNLRGEIYLLNKMFDQATKDFTAAIILNPMYSDAFLNRARAYSERGMEEEAESDYNQAIKAAPEKFSSFDDLDSSESLFEEESSSTKEKAASYFQQGLEDLKNEKYSEAIENLTQAIILSSNDASPYIYRGQAYIELGQPDEAMVDLNRAVIYDPLNPALYYWRAMAWKALDSPINLVADLKLSCELGYEPACNEYQNHKPKKH